MRGPEGPAHRPFRISGGSGIMTAAPIKPTGVTMSSETVLGVRDGRVRKLLPSYLEQTYRWAYLDRRLLPWLDRPVVVGAILWGNAPRLVAAAVEQFEPGQRVLQAAAVYGDFSRRLAGRLGSGGRLEVLDVASLQVANVRRKCAGMRNVRARVHDLTCPIGETYDAACCFFLLHEVPPASRVQIVSNLLASVGDRGMVVFVDYHRPGAWHPLAPVMRWIFRRFEPFAPSLLDCDLSRLAPQAAQFGWSHRLLFGGLYQIVVARRRRDA